MLRDKSCNNSGFVRISRYLNLALMAENYHSWVTLNTLCLLWTLLRFSGDFSHRFFLPLKCLMPKNLYFYILLKFFLSGNKATTLALECSTFYSYNIHIHIISWLNFNRVNFLFVSCTNKTRKHFSRMPAAWLPIVWLHSEHFQTCMGRWPCTVRSKLNKFIIKAA